MELREPFDEEVLAQRVTPAPTEMAVNRVEAFPVHVERRAPPARVRVDPHVLAARRAPELAFGGARAVRSHLRCTPGNSALHDLHPWFHSLTIVRSHVRMRRRSAFMAYTPLHVPVARIGTEELIALRPFVARGITALHRKGQLNLDHR